ncbi:dTMP kinase [Pinirhizobacter sp.]|jgi:dTMP kinase|uniref:dTMP kinase n=1 Tax=Pinirhizobacter sp. TaxID=2950432 RepID=UPI002F40FD74
MTQAQIPGGFVLAIEGIDGAGKTTLAASLGAVLRKVGLGVTIGKEPTAGTWGTRLRQSAIEGRLDAADELRYLLLDRREHVESVIAPALERGEVMILDRYYPSTVAYQGAAGLDVHQLLAENDFAPRPDLLLVLDVEPGEGLSRIRARGDKPNHFEDADNLARCRAIFLEPGLLEATIIDASSDAATVLAVARELIYQAVIGKLGERPGWVEGITSRSPVPRHA